MGDYVTIGEQSLWFTERGHGEKTVLVLHGGLSHSDELLDAWQDRGFPGYRLVAYDRRGHGRSPDTDEPFHYSQMADEAVAFVEQVVGSAVHVVGWSDGGIVGLLLAIRRPDLVDRLALIGANFHFSGIHPVNVDFGSPLFNMLSDGYGERSPDGVGHFPTVLAKFSEMVSHEPTLESSDLGSVDAPTLVLAGDDDLVRLEHTCQLFEALPAGELAIIPGASHLAPLEHIDLVAGLIRTFLDREGRPETLMPIRRSN